MTKSPNSPGGAPRSVTSGPADNSPPTAKRSRLRRPDLDQWRKRLGTGYRYSATAWVVMAGFIALGILVAQGVTRISARWAAPAPEPLSDERMKALQDQLDRQKKQLDQHKEQLDRQENVTKSFNHLKTELAKLVKPNFSGSVADGPGFVALSVQGLHKAAESVNYLSEGLVGIGTRLRESAEMKLWDRVAEPTNRIPPKQAGARVEPEPAEIILFALDSHKLPVKDYAPNLKDLVNELVKEHNVVLKKPLSVFYVTGGVFKSVAFVREWKLEQNQMDQYSEAYKGATEELAKLGTQVMQKYQEKKGRRRCLIIASTECASPLGEESWKDCNLEADAILIQPKSPLAPPADAEKHLLDWSDWCVQRNGRLEVLRHNQLGLLKRILAELLHRAHGRF